MPFKSRIVAMSNKYEREIEEILRKMDDGGRPPTMSERVRAMNRRPTPIRRARPMLRPEVGLLAGVIIAFAAQTARWILQTPNPLQDTIIGIATLVGFAIFLATLIWGWFGGNSTARPGWRGAPLGGQQRGPFASLRTRMNLWRMKFGYRRRAR
jgi:hypothetical protein